MAQATYLRWTHDTTTAFVLALRATGTVRRAAAVIGRDKSTCYQTRQRDPGLAVAWDHAVAELAARKRAALTEARARQRAARREARQAATAAATAAAAAAGVERDASGNRRRWSGLTLVKRRAFLRALSETGTVAAACRAAGVSDTAVLKLRDADPDFAAAWARALATAGPTLKQIARERAVEGWEEPVFVGGRQVGVRRRFSERLLTTLLVEEQRSAATASDPAALVAAAKAAARAAGGYFTTPATREETNVALIARLDKMERRLGLPPLPLPAPEPAPTPVAVPVLPAAGDDAAPG